MRTSRFVLLCLPAVLLRPAAYAWAQEPTPGLGGSISSASAASDLSGVLSGRDVPNALRLSDLDASWRVFDAGGAASLTLYEPFSAVMSSTSAGSAFYTLGQTVVVGDTTLLVAYRLVLSPLQMQAQEQAQPRRYHSYTEPPPIPRLPAQTPLALTLLNLRQTPALSNIRPFDPSIIAPEAVTRAEQTRQAADAASVNNLKQLGLALAQYTQDYDEKLPPMRSATSLRHLENESLRPLTQIVQAVLLPYARSTAIFAHPGTHQIYRPNPILSGKSLQHIANPSAMIAFYEASASPDGKRAVLFLDGHVERVPEENWPSLMRASRIPGAPDREDDD